MTEDVKQAIAILRHCEESGAHCGECPSGKDENGIPNCYSMSAIADLIEQLTAELEQVKRERDAAVRDVKSLCATNYFSGDYCEYCKYNEPDGQCHHDCTPYSVVWGWQWRGVCAENSREVDG